MASSSLAPVPLGLVVVNADYDVKGHETAVAISNARGNAMYPNAEHAANRGVRPRELAFVSAQRMQEHVAENLDAKPPVLSVINGQAAEAAAAHPNDPDFVADTLRNGIKVMGAVMYELSGNDYDTASGVTLQARGLGVLRQGNVAERHRVMPGDEMVAVPSKGGAAGLRSVVPEAKDRGRYLLDVKPLEPRTVCTRLQRQIKYALRDPAQYRAVMGGMLVGTNAWMTAVKHTIDSYLGAGLLQVAEYVDAEVLAPTAAVTDSAAWKARNAKAAASGATLGQRTAVFLGANMGLLTPSIGGVAVAPQNLDAYDRKAYAELRHRLARVVFVDAADRMAHFGLWSKRPGRKPHQKPDKAVRAGELRATRVSEYATGVIKDDEFGQLLRFQYTHFSAAAGGFNHAVLDEQRNKVGTAITGSNPDGYFQIMLNVGA